MRGIRHKKASLDTVQLYFAENRLGDISDARENPLGQNNK